MTRFAKWHSSVTLAYNLKSILVALLAYELWQALDGAINVNQSKLEVSYQFKNNKDLFVAPLIQMDRQDRDLFAHHFGQGRIKRPNVVIIRNTQNVGHSEIRNQRNRPFQGLETWKGCEWKICRKMGCKKFEPEDKGEHGEGISGVCKKEKTTVLKKWSALIIWRTITVNQSYTSQ